MKADKKYEQWKAITESDFVTLFIKTWFTYIAALRELNPDVSVFAEDGKPRGDKPFLNAFKEGIMPIVQKQVPIETMAQELFRMYPVSMAKVIDIFPQYFFQTFFRINELFNYTDKTIETDQDGKFRERYEVHLHIVDRYCLKFKLGMSGVFRTTNYNETVKKDIDLRPIIDATVNMHKSYNSAINELEFMRDFYIGIMDEIGHVLQYYLDVILPTKGYNQTVIRKIYAACQRLQTALNVKFDYNYKYPHDIGALDDFNSYAIIYQIPFNRFGRILSENLYSTNEGFYSELVTTKGIDWFASYVYSLRNALFHEIITPLDEDWQYIFKSAYLALKQVSDVCIEMINRMENFSSLQNNAVLDYVTEHQIEVFSDLGDNIELLNYSELKIHDKKIEHGRVLMSGSFRVHLRRQSDSPGGLDPENGIIEEIEKVYSFEAALNDDFSLIYDNVNNMYDIKIQAINDEEDN